MDGYWLVVPSPYPLQNLSKEVFIMAKTQVYSTLTEEQVFACRLVNQAAVGGSVAVVGGAVAAVCGAGLLKCLGAAVLTGIVAAAVADVVTKKTLENGGCEKVDHIYIPFC
jgi:hypothetical protein